MLKTKLKSISSDSEKAEKSRKKQAELQEKAAKKKTELAKAAMNMNSVSNISSVNTTKSDATTDVLLGRVRDRSLEKEKDERNELRNLRKKEIEYNRRIEMSMKNKKKINNKEKKNSTFRFVDWLVEPLQAHP